MNSIQLFDIFKLLFHNFKSWFGILISLFVMRRLNWISRQFSLMDAGRCSIFIDSRNIGQNKRFSAPRGRVLIPPLNFLGSIFCIKKTSLAILSQKKSPQPSTLYLRLAVWCGLPPDLFEKKVFAPDFFTQNFGCWDGDLGVSIGWW